MGYITPEYYNNTYKGANAGVELEKYIERATDLIDQVTGYEIKDFDSLPDFIKNQVEKATAAQVEFYVMQGGDAALNAGANDLKTVGIGSFNYNVGSPDGQGGVGSKDSQRVSPSTLSFLKPTGLLYSGLDVSHNVFY